MTTEIVHRARKFAQKKHKDQKYCGKPFIFHPMLTATILSTVLLFRSETDYNLLAAAYLHDTLEDTETTYEELVKEFNQDIADLVFEVTKTGYNKFPNLKTQRGILLKFADRLSNLAHTTEWTEEKRERYLLKSKFWEI